MVHRRLLGGEELVFGNQGALFGNAMTWWDHDTGSVWSQPIGTAIMGPREGETLELIPSTLTLWSSWKEAHPDTVALDVRAAPSRFSLFSTVIVVEFGEVAVAYPYGRLIDVGVANDVVGGTEIAVVIDPADRARWMIYSRRVGSDVVELASRDGALVDKVSGTRFDPLSGVGIEGPLAGMVLGRLPGFTSFPDDFHTFFPDGRIWSP